MNFLGFLKRTVGLSLGKKSQVVMKHPSNPEQLTVPNHSGKEVKKGLLSTILKQAKIKTTKR
jgi:predicted RNA binding protein YcfA (HicA-like mRNA interferase family)